MELNNSTPKPRPRFSHDTQHRRLTSPDGIIIIGLKLRHRLTIKAARKTRRKSKIASRKLMGHESCIIILVAVSRVPCYYVTVIRSFKTPGTEDIFNGKNTKAARRICPQNLWKIASRRLDQLDSVDALDQLRIPPGNRLETLTGDRKGQHRFRINDQYRICFVWAETEPDEVDIVDYH